MGSPDISSVHRASAAPNSPSANRAAPDEDEDPLDPDDPGEDDTPLFGGEADDGGPQGRSEPRGAGATPFDSVPPAHHIMWHTGRIR